MRSTLGRASGRTRTIVGSGLLLVVAISVAVGVLVYRLTAGGDPSPSQEGSHSAQPHLEGEGDMWAGGEVVDERGGEAVGTPTGRDIAASPDPRPGAPEGYIPVGASATSWHARLGGAMGLVIAVAIGAIGLALSLWALVSLVARLVSDTPPAA